MIKIGSRNLKYKIKKKCTLCKGNILKPILSFGKTPLANSYPIKKKKQSIIFSLKRLFM